MAAAGPSTIASAIFGQNSAELSAHQIASLPPPMPPMPPMPSISSHPFPPPPPSSSSSSSLLLPIHSSQSSPPPPPSQICGFLNSPILVGPPNPSTLAPPHFLPNFEDHPANLALAVEQNRLAGHFPAPFGFGCANAGEDPSSAFGHLIAGGSALFFPPQSSPGDHLLLMGGTGPPTGAMPSNLLIPDGQFGIIDAQQQHFLIQPMAPPPPPSLGDNSLQHQFLLQLAPQPCAGTGPSSLISPPSANEPNAGAGGIQFPSQCGIGQQNAVGMEIGGGGGILPTMPMMQMPRNAAIGATKTTLPNRRQTQQPRTRRRDRLGNVGGKSKGGMQQTNGQKGKRPMPGVGHEMGQIIGNGNNNDVKLEMEIKAEKSSEDGIVKQPQISNNVANEIMAMPMALGKNNPNDSDLIIPLPSGPSSSSILSIESPNGFAANSAHRCGHCGEEIHEKQMLQLGAKKMAPNSNGAIPTLQSIEEKLLKEQQMQQYFHVQCLKCSECEEPLEMAPKCFVRNGLIFCSQCYAKSFVLYCATCEKQIEPTVWFRRARNWIYHLVCLRCEHCQRQLNTGEQFALDDTTQHHSQVLGQNIPRLLCKQHYMELVRGEQCSPKPKAKRVRTTFEENQLAILQEHFKVDSNPDGADLERIAQLTGLTKRVTQVWFQNSRARQKKYSGHGGNSTNGGGSSSNGTGRKLNSNGGGGGGPGSSSNSNNSSTAGMGGIDDGILCRSSTGSPDSSGDGCLDGGNSPFGGFGGNESEDNGGGGGNGLGLNCRRRLFSIDTPPMPPSGQIENSCLTASATAENEDNDSLLRMRTTLDDD